MSKRITDTTIKNLDIKDKEYTFTVEVSLQLRIRPKRSTKGLGTKAWQFKYRHPVTKKITKIQMGTYPDLRLATAKLEAAEYRRLLAEGTDPKRAKEIRLKEEQRQHTNTFEVIASEWFSKKRKKVSAFHAERVWRTLNKYIFPHLNQQPINSITRRDAIELLRPLEKKGQLSTIKRICQSLNQIMEFAVATDVLTVNPLTTMINAFEKHKVKHMPTIRPEMLGDLLVRLENCNTIQTKTKLVILWQLHTMTRPKESARTRWKDINIADKCWTIPASEMKGNKTHRIPLSDEAIEILNQIRPHSEHHEFVFPGERNSKSHLSVFTANAALKRSLRFKNQLVAHGLRSIASTALYEQGFDTLHIEACLSHSDQNETRASYNRSDFYEQRISIMRWWSNLIKAHTPVSS